GMRRIAAGRGAGPDSIGIVEDRDRNGPLRSGVFFHGSSPGVQLGTRDANDAAGHVQPERTRVVLQSPLHGIAGQSVSIGNSCDAAVFHAAPPAFGSGPEGAFRIEAESVDPALAQTVGGPILRPDLPTLEIDDAALRKAKPEAIPHGVGCQCTGLAAIAEGG